MRCSGKGVHGNIEHAIEQELGPDYDCMYLSNTKILQGPALYKYDVVLTGIVLVV